MGEQVHDDFDDTEAHHYGVKYREPGNDLPQLDPVEGPLKAGIEKIVKSSARAGYEIAKLGGFDEPPDPGIVWEDDRPIITHWWGK